MSTYTDLHNKIKETLNVDYCSRDTFQEVHFKDPRNEYYGTFKGTFEAEGINVNGGTLSDVNIIGVTLSNVTYPAADGGKIDFDNIGRGINAISTELTSLRDTRISTIESNLTAETDKRRKDDEYLSGQINILKNNVGGSALSTKFNELDNKISSVSANIIDTIDDVVDQISSISANLCTEILNEADIRKRNDDNIINLLSDISSYLSTSVELSVNELIEQLDTECDNRKFNDSLLSSNINSESARALLRESQLESLTLSVDQNSINRYNSMISQLDAHNQLNIEQFNVAKNEMLSTVEKERHYKFEDALITRSYPYELHDFTVNRIETTLVDNFVCYNDNIIGQAFYTDDGVDIQFYDLSKYSELLVALNSYEHIEFKGNNTLEVKNRYTISYNAENNTLILSLNGDEYYNIVFSDGTAFGRIYDALFDTSNKIESGKLTITTSKPEYVDQFTFINLTEFSKENSVLTSDIINNEIIFDYDSQKFILRVGVSEKYYQVITTNTNSTNVGKIYKSTLTYDSENTINGLAVKLNSFDNEIKLNSENNFLTEYTANKILSCNIDEYKQCTLVQYDKHAFYKYGIYLSTDYNYSGNIYGYVILTSENGNITDLNYEQISVQYEYESDDKNIYLKGDYLLTLDRNVEYNLWKFEKIVNSQTNDKIIITFDGQYLMFHGIIAGEVIETKYNIRINYPEIYNTDTYLQENWTSNVLDLTVFSNVEDTQAIRDEATISNNKTIVNPNAYTLNIELSSEHSIEMIIPLRTTTNISRELMIVCNFTSTESHKNLSFSYVSDDCSCSRPAKINDTDTPLFTIPMNIEVVLKVKEIAVGHFEVVDMRENHQYDLISKLSTDLKGLSGECNSLSTFLNNKINKLSVDLSAEINSLSTALSGEIDNLSVKLDEKITTNKDNIDILFTRLQGGIWYKGRAKIDDSTTTFAAAISTAYASSSITDDEVLNTQLSAGWYYVVEAEDIEKHYIIEGKDVENKDWILLKQDSILKNVTSAIVDIVDMMDADVVTKALANQLSTNLEKQISDLCVELSTVLSTYTDTSVKALSDALSGEINDLCVELSTVLSTYTDNSVKNLSIALSNEVDDLCVELSTVLSTYTDTSVKELSSELTADINYLSSELSDYHNTLSGIDRKHHDQNVGHIIETDNLMLTDVTAILEGKEHPKYYMTMLSGTLVLKQI